MHAHAKLAMDLLWPFIVILTLLTLTLISITH